MRCREHRAAWALTFKFGAAIDRGRVGGILLPIGLSAGAIEHVVRADLDQKGPLRLAGFGQPPHGGGVDQNGQLGFRLAAVNLGEGSAIDQDVRANLRDNPANGIWIAQIKNRLLRKDQFVSQPGFAEGLGQLSGPPVTKTRIRVAPCAPSRPSRRGSQGHPHAGFHRLPRTFPSP